MSANTSCSQLEVSEIEVSRLADKAKIRSLLILANDKLLDSEGELITRAMIAKETSRLSMDSVKDGVSHCLGFFHGLGFLCITDKNGKRCTANVADGFRLLPIKLDAKVLCELIGNIELALRAVSKGLLSEDDAGKYISRLVYAIKNEHSL